MDTITTNGAGTQAGYPTGTRMTTSPFEHYIYIARRRWKLIAGILLAALVLGIVVTLLTTPRYRADARIEISQIDTNVTNVETLDDSTPAGGQAYLQTQYELLEARSLAERVARSQNLQNDPSFRDAYDIADETELSLNSVIGILLRDISIEPVVASNLVDIQYTSTDAALSAKIANAWANQFLASNLDRRFGANNQAREILSESIQEVREDLEDSERQLIAYATDQQLITLGAENGGAEGGRSRTLVSDELEALSDQLAQATAARIAADAARGNPESGNSQTQGSIATLRRELASAQADLAQAQSTLGSEHPRIIALRSQIDTLNSAISQETRRSGAEAGRAASAAAANEAGLRQRFNALRSQYLDEQRAGVQYAALEREVRTNRELYDALLQQYKNLGAAGVGRNNMAIVDLAEVPRGPIEPNLPSNLLLFFGLGMVLATVTIIAMENIDRGFADPASVPDELGIPLIGAIPTFKDDPVEEIGVKSSDLYESYTTARSNLSLLTARGMPRTLMLTSSRAAEGKSMTAFALSKLTAEQGLRTLMIDADMRNSGIGKYVDYGKGTGLSNLLAGETFDSSATQRPKGEKFDILPPGPIPPNAAELLAGSKLADLIEGLLQTYDHIIVDGPPVLGLADAQEIGRAVEGAVIVIESGGSKRRAIQQSVARLESAGTEIFGAILTKVSQTDMSYGYGYGYGTGYGYGYGPGKEAEA